MIHSPMFVNVAVGHLYYDHPSASETAPNNLDKIRGYITSTKPDIFWDVPFMSI